MTRIESPWGPMWLSDWNDSNNCRERDDWIARKQNRFVITPEETQKLTLDVPQEILEWLHEDRITNIIERFGQGVFAIEIPDDLDALHFKLRWGGSAE